MPCIKSTNCNKNSMIILGLILFLLGFIIYIVIVLNKHIDGISAVCGFFSGMFIIAGAGCFSDEANYPRAIDVYRGKTTLQITYKGSIPIDTTVVYK